MLAQSHGTDQQGNPWYAEPSWGDEPFTSPEQLAIQRRAPYPRMTLREAIEAALDAE